MKTAGVCVYYTVSLLKCYTLGLHHWTYSLVLKLTAGSVEGREVEGRGVLCLPSCLVAPAGSDRTTATTHILSPPAEAMCVQPHSCLPHMAYHVEHIQHGYSGRC